MSKEKFRVVVTGIVTNQGDVLVGKKEEEEGHLSQEWHFPGSGLEKGEEVEEALSKEIEEETGLEVEVHQLLDTRKYESDDREPILRILFHCESGSRDAEANGVLEEVKWVEPENLEDEIGEFDSKLVGSDRISTFIQKLEKMPAF